MASKQASDEFDILLPTKTGTQTKIRIGFAFAAAMAMLSLMVLESLPPPSNPN
jgi:hypothetical protein